MLERLRTLTAVRPILACLAGLLVGLTSLAVAAEPIQIVDNSGRTVRLAAPAQRIVVLAPDLLENLFAVGAGGQVVGRVARADFPPAARSIPLVGDSQSLNLEAILALKPDLVLAWSDGNPPSLLHRLEGLGLKVARFAPHHIGQIGDNLRVYGQLSGHAAAGDTAAQAFERRLAELKLSAHQYAGHARPVLFYQLWGDPLMTVNHSQLIDQAIRLCGARNPFSDLPEAIPQLGVEAVIAARPDIIVASDENGVRWQQRWRTWDAIPAVAHRQLYPVSADQLHRASPRFLKGVTSLCRIVESWRKAH